MALLNPPEVVPSVMRVIYDYATFRGSPLEQEDLERTICPPSVMPSARPVFKASLQAAIEIGLVRQSDGAVLAEDVRGTTFGQILRQCVFNPGNNDPLATSDKGASDLTRALAWFLAQDTYMGVEPWVSDGRRGVQKLQDEQFTQSRAFQNDTRWTSFNRWAPILGLAVHVPWNRAITLLPDPANAVEDELPQIFGSDQRVALDVFVDRLCQRIPVLDRGLYRVSVEALTSLASSDDVLSYALSHALWRLEARGALQLQSLADAKQFMLQGSANAKVSYSHVERSRTPGQEGLR